MKFITQLLSQHLARYPSMGIADIYKLLHQAALGPAHAIDGLAARSKLDAEFAQLTDGFVEPLIDVISPDGRLARVHLRAYAKIGRSWDDLTNAFFKTAANYSGSMEKLSKFCGCLGDLADARGIPFAGSEVEAYMRAQADAGYPAVRHSQAFRDAYQPAYRVVDLQELPQDLLERAAR